MIQLEPDEWTMLKYAGIVLFVIIALTAVGITVAYYADVMPPKV